MVERLLCMWKARGSIPRISILYPSVCDSATPHPQQLYFTHFHLDYKGGTKVSPRPGIEPGPSTWQAEILTTRLSRTVSTIPIFQIVIWHELKKDDKSFNLPSSRIWTSDLWMSDIAQLQSTALPTELSKGVSIINYYPGPRLNYDQTIHKKSWVQKNCVGRESNPDQLLGRQLCWPLYHRRPRSKKNLKYLSNTLIMCLPILPVLDSATTKLGI